MLLNLLNSDPTRFVGVGEAGLYALIGFAVVFLGIAFLIFIVWLVGRVLSKTKAQSTPIMKKATNEQEQTKTTNASPKTETVEVAEEELSEETVAIIMAALTAYYEKNNPKCEFTVKRIKRI